MRNEDLKTLLTDMDDKELTETISIWRAKREMYIENNPAPKRRAAKKQDNKLKNLILSLSPEEQASLIAEFSK